MSEPRGAASLATRVSPARREHTRRYGRLQTPVLAATALAGACLAGILVSGGGVERTLAGVGIAALALGAALARTSGNGSRAGTPACDADPVTGLLSHSAFNERLAAEMEQARAAGRDLALAVLDIDRFREVNERLGHTAGDRALREVAARLRRVARPGEALGRVEGDQFGWIQTDADDVAGLIAATRARVAVFSEPIAGVGRLSGSFGVATAAAAESPGELVRLAVGALYWAKEQGLPAVRYTRDVDRALSAEERARRLERQQTLATVQALARAVDAKDASTRRHSERVADLCVALATALGWQPERSAQLREAALVHDVGKIGIPDAILLKPGRLTREEFAQITTHVELGVSIVAGVLSAEQVHWIAAHHERLDGRGYPKQVAADEIPEGARILAVADAWDVMTSDRPYSPPLSVEDALEECRMSTGGQFDPRVVAALEALVESGALGADGRLR